MLELVESVGSLPERDIVSNVRRLAKATSDAADANDDDAIVAGWLHAVRTQANTALLTITDASPMRIGAKLQKAHALIHAVYFNNVEANTLLLEVVEYPSETRELAVAAALARKRGFDHLCPKIHRCLFASWRGVQEGSDAVTVDDAQLHEACREAGLAWR